MLCPHTFIPYVATTSFLRPPSKEEREKNGIGTIHFAFTYLRYVGIFSSRPSVPYRHRPRIAGFPPRPVLSIHHSLFFLAYPRSSGGKNEGVCVHLSVYPLALHRRKAGLTTRPGSPSPDFVTQSRVGRLPAGWSPLRSAYSRMRLSWVW